MQLSYSVLHPCTTLLPQKNLPLSVPFRSNQMSLFRVAARLRVPRITPVVSRLAYLPTQRFNSTAPKDISLTAQVYPLDKDTITEADVDEWLSAVQTLKEGKKAPETEAEVYLSQLANPEPFLEEKFEPTEDQLAQVENYANKAVPLPSDPVIDNFANLIMRDGKKTRARKQLSRALYIVYLKTRQDPVKLLYETLDKLGPLFHTKVQKTGTAKSRTVPFPLDKRQRNRYAILWILEGSKKKKSLDFSVRLAEEIISAWEGKSSGYDKKTQLHKSAIAHRAYIQL